MKTHELKIWPSEFNAVKYDFKTAEFREEDREFEIGDDLLLQEYEPDKQEYTGRTVLVGITHIVPGGNFGIPEGYCMLSIKRV